jgi:hypothetical protein
MIIYALNYTTLSMVDLATAYCIVRTVETLTAGFPVGAVEDALVSIFSMRGVPIAMAAVATTLCDC